MTALAQDEEDSLAATEPASVATKGLFVVFEGVDGTGKSTVSRMVHSELLRELPGRVILTVEPSDSWLGDCVRRANVEDVGPFAEALLFMADRAEHTRQIASWLEQGNVVICDRYYASTLAYQGALLKEAMGTKKAVEWLKEVNRPIIIQPDLTILLTMKVSAALERLKSRKGKTKFESMEYLQDVDLIYRNLAMEDVSFHTLDASRSAGQVTQDALRLIRNKL